LRQIILVMIMGVILVISGCTSMNIAHEKEISYIVEIPSHSKEQIFDGAKIWIAQNFRSAKAVLEYENRDEGVLIGNGIESYPCFMGCGNKGSMNVSYTMRIDIKDNKIKLSFFNLLSEYSGSGIAYSKRDEDGVKPKLMSYGEKLRDSIDKDSKSDDW